MNVWSTDQLMWHDNLTSMSIRSNPLNSIYDVVVSDSVVNWGFRKVENDKKKL